MSETVKEAALLAVRSNAGLGAEAGFSIVRHNLMTERGYAPYCGAELGCNIPRTKWDGEQFRCPCCGWRSQFPDDFIAGYKAKWHQAPNCTLIVLKRALKLKRRKS